MPRTTKSFVSLSVERTVKVSPMPRSRSSATLFGSTAPSSPSCVSTSSEPSSQRKPYTWSISSSRPVRFAPSPSIWAMSCADVAHGLDALDVGHRVADGGRELGVAVLGRDDQVGLDLALDRVAVRHAQAVGEDGDERHERDADHQRGRGRGRSARVALRVPLGDLCPPRRRGAAPGCRRRARAGGRAARRASRRR